MPSFPTLLKAANPFKGKAVPAKKSFIPLGGSTTSIDDQTLAAVYQTGAYNDPGVSFGPGTPPHPQPIDNSGQPRRFQPMVGHNLMGRLREGHLDPELCQSLVDHYDLFRQAIYIRIDEIACMDWDIIPDPLVARSVKDKRDLNHQYHDQILAARQFFKKPDRVNTFQIWMRNILEDHFIFDAMTIYKRRTRGGKLYALEYLDGSVVKPLLNVQSRIPDPPETAYQQYYYGIPRFDFTRDELIYAPKNVRPRSVYGLSIVEQFLIHINMALRFQAWNTAFFTDGNIPSRLLTAPDNWTADKILEWQELFDAMLAGDPAAQRKLFMIPPGVEEIGGGNEGMFQYALEFSNYLIDITCVATGVTREELGLEPANSEGFGGAGMHDAMESGRNRRLVRLATFLTDVILTPILQEELGLPHFVWSWPSLENQDPQAHAELNQLLLFSGQKSFDEILMEQGQEALGIGRMINLGGKLLFEQDLLKLQEEGTLAFEQKQAAEQQQSETENQQQLAEHAAGLQKDQAEHAADLQQQTAEHAAGLAQQQAEQQTDLAQQTAEHGAGLQQEQAEHGAGLQQEATAQKGDLDLAAKEQQSSLDSKQLDQQAGIAAQESRQGHQQELEQTQAAAQYAGKKAGASTKKPLTPQDTPAAPVQGTGNPSMTGTPVPNLGGPTLVPGSLTTPGAPRGTYSLYLPKGAGMGPDPGMVKEELDQWRRKVEKGMKMGKAPAKVLFTPHVLPWTQEQEVRAGLVALGKVGMPPVPAVRNLFKAVLDGAPVDSPMTPGSSPPQP